MYFTSYCCGCGRCVRIGWEDVYVPFPIDSLIQGVHAPFLSVSKPVAASIDRVLHGHAVDVAGRVIVLKPCRQSNGWYVASPW